MTTVTVLYQSKSKSKLLMAPVGDTLKIYHSKLVGLKNRYKIYGRISSDVFPVSEFAEQFVMASHLQPNSILEVGENVWFL